MDQRQRSTLRAHHIHLANELIVDEDFFASLRQNKIFTDGMLQIIKDVRKQRDQVYKMLELLEKRGPTAYDNFVWILRENFSWLADKLEETYKIKQFRKKSSIQRARSTPQETMNKTRVPTSIPIPTSANSSRNLNGKKVYFKDETSDQDDDYAVDVDVQDGETVKTSSSKQSNGIKTTTKQYVDKCMSPIQIIECPKKPFQQDFITGPDEVESKHVSIQNELEVNTENEKNQDALMIDDDDSVFEDENSDASDLNGLDSDDGDELEDGEIFYDRIRRESEINETGNNDLIQMSANDDVDGDIEQVQRDADSQLNSSIEFGQTEDDSEIQDMYAKLLECTKSVLDCNVDLCQMGITYKMINELIDKLIEDKENGEESVKMVQKCLSLFQEKDRKFPLNKMIEKLMEEKSDTSNRLFEEIRKTNEMAHDMYIHSQEMKSLEKMKARMNELEKENSLLQMKKLNLERDSLEKDRRINELEKNTKLFEEIRQGGTDKKPLPTRRNSQRRITPGMQSQRKPSLGPNSQMTSLRATYTGGQSSPRPAASSAWTRHYPKR